MISFKVVKQQPVEGITIRHIQKKHLAVVPVSLYPALFKQKAP